MNMKERIKNWKLHPSMRGQFSFELYKAMAKDNSIWLVVGDLGWGVFDAHFQDYPDRCINTGAAETAMMGIGVGLALEGKKPFCYSITTFLLYRPFETIKLYIDYEQIPARLIGSGRDHDYHIDGISHWADDAKDILNNFKNINSLWPDTKEEISDLVKKMVKEDKPSFISLRR